MATFKDFVYIILILVVFGGAIAAITFVVNAVSEFLSATKENLRSRGYSISDQGVKVHTQKRFNREDYVDATQRGFVKVIEASSFGKANGAGSASSSNKSKTPEDSTKKTRSGLLRRHTDK